MGVVVTAGLDDLGVVAAVGEEILFQRLAVFIVRHHIVGIAADQDHRDIML